MRANLLLLRITSLPSTLPFIACAKKHRFEAVWREAAERCYDGGTGRTRLVVQRAFRGGPETCRAAEMSEDRMGKGGKFDGCIPQNNGPNGVVVDSRGNGRIICPYDCCGNQDSSYAKAAARTRLGCRQHSPRTLPGIAAACPAVRRPVRMEACAPRARRPFEYS